MTSFANSAIDCISYCVLQTDRQTETDKFTADEDNLCHSLVCQDLVDLREHWWWTSTNGGWRSWCLDGPPSTQSAQTSLYSIHTYTQCLLKKHPTE